MPPPPPPPTHTRIPLPLQACATKYIAVCSGVLSPGSLAKDLLIFDSISLSRTPTLLTSQLHALQESPSGTEVAGQQEVNSKVAANRAVTGMLSD